MRVTVILVAAVAALAQPRPAFEAAEIKVNTSGTDDDSSRGTKGQVIMHNMSLKSLVERAYGLTPPEVIGPGWLTDVRFDIAAKYPPDTKPEDRDVMLRTLLEDQLKLAAHRETREMPGYVLSVAKNGFKLKPVEPGPGGTSSNGGAVRTLKATKLSMATFCRFLARNLRQTVVDRTGIDGVYDFELKWARDELDAAAEAPSLFVVLQEQLGLKLQAQKVPVEIVVVDHAERAPVEN